MKILSVAIALYLLMVTPFINADTVPKYGFPDAAPQIEIEVRTYRSDGHPEIVADDKIKLGNATADKSGYYFPNGGELIFEDATVVLNQDEWKVRYPDGETPFNKDPLSFLDAMAMPRITMLQYQKAMIHVVEDKAINFLRKHPDDPEGYYRLGVLSAVELGIGITAIPIVKADKLINLTIRIEVNTIEKREPLEGTNLNVGYPIIDVLLSQTTQTLESGGKYGMIFMDEDGGSFLFQITARIVEQP